MAFFVKVPDRFSWYGAEILYVAHLSQRTTLLSRRATRRLKAVGAKIAGAVAGS
jgi:hypothetical protein